MIVALKFEHTLITYVFAEGVDMGEAIVNARRCVDGANVAVEYGEENGIVSRVSSVSGLATLTKVVKL